MQRAAEAGLQFDDLKQTVIEQGQDNNVVRVPAAQFLPASFEMVDKLKGVEDGFIANVNDTASSLASEASNTAFLYLLFTTIAVAAALIIAFLRGPGHDRAAEAS